MVSEDSKIKSIQPELSQVWSGERCLPGAMCCDKELEGLVPKVGWEGRAVKWGRGRAVMLALPARDEGIINSSPTPLSQGLLNLLQQIPATHPLLGCLKASQWQAPRQGGLGRGLLPSMIFSSHNLQSLQIHNLRKS